MREIIKREGLDDPKETVNRLNIEISRIDKQIHEIK